MANEETGFGRWEDKVMKNRPCRRGCVRSDKRSKNSWCLKECKEEGLMEIGVPMGVMALIKSTNPTSTTIYKIMIALKAGNGVIISPHPNTLRTVLLKRQEYLIEAAERKVLREA